MASQARTSHILSPSSRPIAFCDFDGTVTEVDVTDQILIRLADPAWRAIEEEWVQGKIGSRECLKRQMALVQAPVDDLNALIDSIPIDPHFLKLHSFFQERKIPLYVLSDSFDYIIRRVLKRCGINGAQRNGTHLFASVLRIRGRQLAPRFPYAGPSCEHGCATCKVAIIRRLSGGRRPIIFIGDGLSDRFAIEVSDIVFAKRELFAYCQGRGMECHRFRTLGDVEAKLGAMMRNLGGRRMARPPFQWLGRKR